MKHHRIDFLEQFQTDASRPPRVDGRLLGAANAAGSYPCPGEAKHRSSKRGAGRNLVDVRPTAGPRTARPDGQTSGHRDTPPEGGGARGACVLARVQLSATSSS